ncbi:MAG: PD-(D/E)XK nuclease family protein [SAR324 cluster bacterium]|nr:PD-(D/E)XK nuclease family protein [SAR324 cluster bacterium]
MIDSKYSPRLPESEINFPSFDNLNQILEDAELHVSPKFLSDVTNERFLKPLQETSVLDAKRLLYVALTRAREQMIIEWPSYEDDKENDNYYNLLKGQARIQLQKDKVLFGDKLSLPCIVTQLQIPEDDELDALKEEQPPKFLLNAFGRCNLKKETVLSTLTPESVSPSSLDHDLVAVGIKSLERLEQTSYGVPLAIQSDLPANEKGLLLHRCFEFIELGKNRAEEISKVVSSYNLEEYQEAIESQVKGFSEFLQSHFENQKLQTEVPFLCLNEEGSTVSGIIDLLVETEKGYWIIDHKSDNTDDYKARFLTHLPQLELYQKALHQIDPTKPVLGVAINWVQIGEIWSLPL